MTGSDDIIGRSTARGPLQLGVSQVTSRQVAGGLLGYVFTEASGRGQLQRWILYEDPQNTLEIGPPPASMASWTFREWCAGVPALWRPGSFYIWAQADIYLHGGTYENRAWDLLPSGTAMPRPTFPPIAGGDFQLDNKPGCIIECAQGAQRGHVFTVGGISNESNAEYWLLPSQFAPAGAGAPASVAPGTRTARSLDDFLQFANTQWSSGHALAIIGCNNYRREALPPPEL